MSPSVEAWSEWGMTQIGGQESCVMAQAVYYFGENTRHSAVMTCSNHTAKVSFLLLDMYGLCGKSGKYY